MTPPLAWHHKQMTYPLCYGAPLPYQKFQNLINGFFILTMHESIRLEKKIWGWLIKFGKDIYHITLNRCIYLINRLI